MNQDDMFLHLIKNPYKSRDMRIYKKDNLYNELRSKFNKYKINSQIYKILLEKIEIFLIEFTIKDIINEITFQLEDEFIFG